MERTTMFLTVYFVADAVITATGDGDEFFSVVMDETDVFLTAIFDFLQDFLNRRWFCKIYGFLIYANTRILYDVVVFKSCVTGVKPTVENSVGICIINGWWARYRWSSCAHYRFVGRNKQWYDTV